MSSSETTVSPRFEEVCRSAALAALARQEFSPVGHHERWHAENWLVPEVIGPFASSWVAGEVGSRTDDPASHLIDRVLGATEPCDIVAAVRLLGFRAIADRLEYLQDLSGEDDSDEPAMVLDSLRELAFFLVSDHHYGDPEIAISPDGCLQTEWQVGRTGIIAMKFLPTGFIQFAGVSGPAGDHPMLRVHGTLPRVRALSVVEAFQGTS